MGRAPCCDKANVKKGPWSPEEDAKLKSYIEQHGTGGNWIALPQKMGLKRCGKSCRLRWLNYLRPNIKHGGFSEEEDNIICSLYISIGSRWSIIAAQLPGRTDNDIKNYWNTRLKKKLLGSKQRKDQSSQSRHAGVLKQEAKREENGDVLMSYDSSGNIGSRPCTYWPEQSTPMYPISQAEHHVSDECSSIRRLLMKIGGRFSTETPNFAVPTQQVSDSSSSLMANSSVQASPLISEGLACTNGFNLTELDEMLGCNWVKLEGLDCFYGSSSLDHSANWSEVSPNLIEYQPMIPSYPPMQ